MQCTHCRNDLLQERDLPHYRCQCCGLIHKANGTALGWSVESNSARGGIIPAKLISALGLELEHDFDVSYLIRIAAELGLEQTEEVRKRFFEKAEQKRLD